MFSHRLSRPARSRALWTVAIVGLVVGGLVTAQAEAQEEEIPINNGAVSVSGGVDFTSQYWFRGMAQENQGFIAQPWIDVSLNLEPVGLEWIDVYGGVWNSIHTNDALVDTDGDGEPNGDQTALFETDWYVGASFALPANMSLDVSYISLHDPAGGDIFAEEIDVSLAYDDSELWGDTGIPGWTGLQPYVLVAIETGGGSDAGSELGRYLEFGISPGFTIVESEDMPIDFSLPITLGISISDYYEVDTDPTAGVNVEDESFGFVDIGGQVSMPLSFMPAELGEWSAYAGVHVIFLGDTTETISGGDPASFSGAFNVTEGGEDTFVYGVFGVSMSY